MFLLREAHPVAGRTPTNFFQKFATARSETRNVFRSIGERSSRCVYSVPRAEQNPILPVSHLPIPTGETTLNVP